MLNYWGDFGFDRSLAWMDDFRRRMDRLFLDYDTNARSLKMSVRDEGKTFVVLAEVPGISQENLKVSLHNGTLTINGERSDDLPEGYTVHRKERAPIQFSRSFQLPAKVDPDKTTAELKDGILKLTLEKAAEAQPRQISVKVA
jgi:HSP20 family protein